MVSLYHASHILSRLFTGISERFPTQYEHFFHISANRGNTCPFCHFPPFFVKKSIPDPSNCVERMKNLTQYLQIYHRKTITKGRPGARYPHFFVKYNHTKAKKPRHSEGVPTFWMVVPMLYLICQMMHRLRRYDAFASQI